MSITILYGESHRVTDAAVEDGEHLWLSEADLAGATGWEVKPEGLCQGHACIPLPPDGSWQDDAGRIDLAAFAARQGRPVVRDEGQSAWAFGQSAGPRGEALRSGMAPDFELPDLDGDHHRLSDHLGKKVFLFTYGSY